MDKRYKEVMDLLRKEHKDNYRDHSQQSGGFDFGVRGSQVAALVGMLIKMGVIDYPQMEKYIDEHS